MKWCSGCSTHKPEVRFSKNRTKRDGLANWCKDCNRRLYTSEANLERRTKMRDANWEHSLVIECRARARKRGLEFNITEADIRVPDACPVLGIPIFRQRGVICDNTPTVDRIRGDLGYVRGNVAVISWKANRLKSDCDDPAIFEAIARYMRSAWNTGTELSNTSREIVSETSTKESSDGRFSSRTEGAARL